LVLFVTKFSTQKICISRANRLYHVKSSSMKFQDIMSHTKEKSYFFKDVYPKI